MSLLNKLSDFIEFRRSPAKQIGVRRNDAHHSMSQLFVRRRKIVSAIYDSRKPWHIICRPDICEPRQRIILQAPEKALVGKLIDSRVDFNL